MRVLGVMPAKPEFVYTHCYAFEITVVNGAHIQYFVLYFITVEVTSIFGILLFSCGIFLAGSNSRGMKKCTSKR